MPYQTVNPFNGEVVRTFDEHTDQQMEQMLANADKTFRENWSKKPVRDRAKIIGKAASLMLEQKEKFARLATLEMGKRIAESRGEVDLKRLDPEVLRRQRRNISRAASPEVNRRRGLH
jgi:succinate-semialdehyde dehydrogenase/glutarate-semialdehyde dehydrogenase